MADHNREYPAPPVRTLDRYRLQEVVGTGAFATVYRAEDPRLDDMVAVKLLAENHSLDVEIRDRFLAEGRVLRRIDSRHVVKVHDLGESDRQQPYLVLSYADRGTLAQRMGRLREGSARWAPAVADLRRVAIQLADAIQAVHAADVVHRDLSPGNVLIGSYPSDAGASSSGDALLADDEYLVVADLGMCKDLALNSGFTAAGGTDGFRSPEQRKGPGVVRTSADLWALSALMVWLAAGDPPDQVDLPSALSRAGWPEPLGPVLMRSLAETPSERHSSVDAWLDDVLAALDGSKRNDAEGAAPTAVRRPSPRRTALAAGVLGAVVGAGGMWLATVGDSPSATDLGDGMVRVEAGADGAVVGIEGPQEANVDETVTFQAELGDEIGRWTWIGPDGQFHSDVEQLTVTPGSAGMAPVTLIGTDQVGDPVTVEHRLEVTDQES